MIYGGWGLWPPTDLVSAYEQACYSTLVDDVHGGWWFTGME